MKHFLNLLIGLPFFSLVVKHLDLPHLRLHKLHYDSLMLLNTIQYFSYGWWTPLIVGGLTAVAPPGHV